MNQRDPMDAVRLLAMNREQKFLTRRQANELAQTVWDWINNPTILIHPGPEPAPAEPPPVSPPEEMQTLLDYHEWRDKQNFLILWGRKRILKPS